MMCVNVRSLLLSTQVKSTGDMYVNSGHSKEDVSSRADGAISICSSIIALRMDNRSTPDLRSMGVEEHRQWLRKEVSGSNAP